ncbi:S-adenosylmethionine-dependent methyltransferase [Hoeflea marina]|uniref:S-adenosylmethionine-dependent methyltransferase n=1 Tax=Hoeflea marina TaxID=274592 RepID=A0A317PIT7_9HYPH|nr:MnmC family methyltransferase [Hoeflea marina]PWV99117.1 S-adenosylmethionine-dependent methyltransferase [Hoeflea marina]
MIPWIRLDAVQLDDGQELRLMSRGSEFSIMLGSNELMNSRLSGSEEALADLSCGRLGTRPRARMLVGGLGMGFTLRAALAGLGAGAELTVAELVPSVVAWARGPMSEVFAGCLEDPRVHVHLGDVGELIRGGDGAWDAILLDVDNGPDGLTRKGNDALYSAAGLRAAHRALAPGGIFSVWSSAPDAAFSRRLRQAGFAVEEVPTRANGKRGGARHMIWLATRAFPDEVNFTSS